MQQLPIALVIAKVDVPHSLTSLEIGVLLGLPELREQVGERLTVVQLSAVSSESLSQVRDFLKQCAQR